MEAKSGEASASAPAAGPSPVVVSSEATVSFQPQSSTAAAPAAAAERGFSSGVLVPPGMAMGGGLAVARPAAVKVEGKKRGRPRKYGPDGSLIRPLNATPISASAPMLATAVSTVAPGQYTPASAVGAAMKRGRGSSPLDFASAAAVAKPYHHYQHHPQPPQQTQQQFGFHFDSIGDMVACSAGGNFTPHIITVAPGEDVTMKVISFSQQGPRAICILSANGVISNVTLHQPDSSGGTLTYEGRFELLSLSGSFMPTEAMEHGVDQAGLSVSLASPDGRVVGGGVAGLLVAASPVQIVVGTFLPSYQMEQKHKKARVDAVAAPLLIHTPPAVPLSSAETHSGEQQGQQHSSTAPRTTNVVTSAYSADQSWPPAVVQSAAVVDLSRTSSGDLKLSASGA